MAIGEPFPEVLAAARLGAEWAWRILYREFAPPLTAYLRGQGAGDPDDLVGEVFLRLFRDLDSFEGAERDFRAFAFTIVHHRLLDERRAGRRRPVTTARIDDVAGERPGGDTEEEALGNLRDAEIRHLIDSLTPDQREVLLLRIVAGLNAEEVAQVVGKGAWAVRALQRRGLAALRKKISREAVQL